MNAPRRIPGPPIQRPQRRSGNIALVLLGAAAVGGAGGWAIDRYSQPPCDPKLDPQCQQQRSGGWYRGSHGGSYWGWGDSSGSRDPSARPSTPTTRSGTTTQRGGFGSIGRFFSSGS